MEAAAQSATHRLAEIAMPVFKPADTQRAKAPVPVLVRADDAVDVLIAEPQVDGR